MHPLFQPYAAASKKLLDCMQLQYIPIDPTRSTK